MTHDIEIEAPLVEEILGNLWAGTSQLATVRCALAHLDPGHHPEASRGLAEYISHSLDDSVGSWTELEAEAAIRLAELGLPSPAISGVDAERILLTHRSRRPDLVDRIRILVGDDR
ncbi:hypothetical protein [Paractinoplanes toevensis]|uniref:Uncharacterized protein n=1 Tax=Paractinoplanes toevensis TaxID=571911 RepID=A0A919T7P1_9ACTN|nr:hypothetical protein [Actinoplanes toevensis]GIM89249.1 hypothetical protein Ato02nite_010420 [Actinoplanes toevensis]